MKSRDILIYLSIKHEGNWLQIYDALQNKEEIDIGVAEQIVAAMKSKAVTILDADYPKYLAKMPRAPFVLFYYGNLSLIDEYTNNLSVVGSRKYSSYGKTVTEDFVSKLAKNYNIVSGMAIGIDSIAHKTCIENGGNTIAVLGCGIDFCYPPSNKDLYKEIMENHLLISEYPGVTEPKPENFPIRNRIIAALSKATLLTEARNGSGSSITAGWALEYNRDILCVPNNIYSDSACNKWISEGAFLVEKVEDVLHFLGN